MSGLRKNAWRVAVVGVALAIGGSIGLAAAGSPSDTDAPPNPAEGVARSMTKDGTALAVDAGSGQACLVTRLGRGSGSSCTSLKATDVMVSYTIGETGFVLGVFDPTQRAITLVADGQNIESSSTTDGDLTYFVSAGSSLPDEIVVLGPAGEDLGRFTPAADAAQARTNDKTAISHD